MSNSLRNPYYRPFWVCLVSGLGLLSVGVGTAVSLLPNGVPTDSKNVCVALALVFVILAIALLVASLLIGLFSRRVHSYIAMMQRGDCLVHWSYSADEWQTFQAAEAPLYQRDFRNSVLLPLLTGLPFGIIVFTVQVLIDKKPDLRGLLFTVIITCLFLGMVLAAAYYLRVVRRRAQSRKPVSSQSDTYLHADFIYANDQFLLGFFSQQLMDIQLHTEKPSRIELTIKCDAPRGNALLETHRLLVPAGQEAKARDVVAAIRQAWQLP